MDAGNTVAALDTVAERLLKVTYPLHFWAKFFSPQGCADNHQHLAYFTDNRYYHTPHSLS